MKVKQPKPVFGCLDEIVQASDVQIVPTYSDMDFVSTFLAVLAVILTLKWIIDQRITAKKYPPGPRGFPFVGYLPFLGNCAHETFHKLGEKYGSVFSVVLGTRKVVVLNDWAAVKAALVDQSITFSGRPEMFLMDSTINHRDIGANSGPIWKTQRTFAIQTLKNAGPDESSFQYNINKLVEKFNKQTGQVISIGDDFFLPVFNTVWTMACGKTIKEDDNEEGKKFYEILKQNFLGFRNNSPLNFMPFLRYLVPGAFGYWTYVKYHKKLWNYLEQEIQEHDKTFEKGMRRDFLDGFIEEVRKREEAKEKLEPPFTPDYVTGSLLDMFLAGVETSSNTLTWSILALSVWPHCQDKIQEELDSVIGRGRVPVLKDIPLLPYLEAVTLELHRFISLAPLSVFHSPLKDTEVLGHPIPKGCMVIQNIYGVHRDSKCWDKPFEFRPERFLDSQNRVQKPEYLIPFSVGARKCMGEPLAKKTMFLFLAGILQKLSFRLPPNTPPPSWEPIVGLTLTPQPFSVIVSVR